MGMFDNLTCKYPLPLTSEIEQLAPDWTSVVFQTKDLDNSLAYYEIREDGFLYHEKITYEYVRYTDEELKTIKPKPWSIFKETIITGRTIDKVDHHGRINFYESFRYSADEDIWVEFVVYFSYGKLDKIELLPTSKSRSRDLCNQDWAESMAAYQKSKWYRFKQAVSPYGWRFAWLGLAKALIAVSEAATKLNMAIYRKML
jgi:hypothetical protein